MFAEAKALVTGPGRYEGLSPFQGWLCQHVDDCADETSGDVESHTGWFALCGRHLVLTDSQGFWYAFPHQTRDAARIVFEAMDEEYAAWL